MFLEDFSRGFSYEFTPIVMRDQFYCITPDDDALKRFLQLYGRHSDFNYKFDQLLSEIVHNMLINGRTYIEIVSFMDQQNAIQGIDFVCIPAKCPLVRRDKYRFTALDRNNKKIFFDVEKKRVVTFDLKDIGFQRNCFRRLANHLSMFDVTNASALMFNPKMKGLFDFEEYQKSIEFKLLKTTRPMHWLGRNYSNQHLSESYHLYRTIQYKTLRYKFLQYILCQINGGLNNFKNEWGFTGSVSVSVSLPDYRDIFSRYNSGEINASTLCDIVVENLMPTEMES